MDITVAWQHGLQLTIHDNGKGLDTDSPATFGSGMRTMRQRVEQLSGTFVVKNHNGTTLVFLLPDPGSTERSIADA